VRPHDFIVIDALAHNCLQHGAYASTPNVTVFTHNSADSLRKRVARIRRGNPDAAILIVAESLYSMDSDTPPLAEFVDIKKEFEAHLLLDIAHDFGVLGADGKGLAHDQISYADADLIIGSFSKTFASIGGFFSTNEINLIRGVQGYSGSYTFSNYLIPPQIAAVSRAFDIAFSPEGEVLRGDVLQNTRRLRQALAEAGIETTGIDSAMVIVRVGEERAAREAYRELLNRGVILNCIEYPAVRRGDARFRLQLTPNHKASDIDRIAGEIAALLGG
jgi:glycine C-acetyltransferase